MPPKKAAAKPKQPRAPKGHQLAKPFPEGEILVDTIFKKRWRIGKPVGQGGFGVLYLGFEDGTPATEPPYVIKIEPHSNGPLFCELNFYQRAAKQDMIEEWRKKRKLKHVGVPRFISTGSHQRNGTNFRYLVMERFNGDLQQAFEKAGKRFPRKTVCMLAIRILTILEYIHDHEYVHADIKAANLLMAMLKAQQNRYMKNIPSLMSACFPEGEKPDEFRSIRDDNKAGVYRETRLQQDKKSRKRKSAAGNDEMDSPKKRPTLKSPTRPTPEVRKAKSPVKKSTPRGKAKSPAKKSTPAKKAVSNGDVKSKKSTPVWPVGAVKSPIRSTNKAAVPKTKVKKVGASVATQTSPWMKKAGKKRTNKAKE